MPFCIRICRRKNYSGITLTFGTLADVQGVTDFTQKTRQRCKNMFMEMSFRGKSLAWYDLPYDKRNLSEENRIGPSYYPTDFGACCLFVPHLDFEPLNTSVPFEDLYHYLDVIWISFR